MPEYRVHRSRDTENLPEVIEPLADAWAEAGSIHTRRVVSPSDCQPIAS
jgi:hypothetical protein